MYEIIILDMLVILWILIEITALSTFIVFSASCIAVRGDVKSYNDTILKNTTEQVTERITLK